VAGRAKEGTEGEAPAGLAGKQSCLEHLYGPLSRIALLRGLTHYWFRPTKPSMPAEVTPVWQSVGVASNASRPCDVAPW
jgi:hypothetical protein